MGFADVDNDYGLITGQVAEWLGVSEDLLHQARDHPGKGPRFVNFRGAIRYRAGDVRAWLREHQAGVETPAPDIIEQWLR